ncbi:MAG: DUF4602 domain-containing protein [Caldilineaceae bacterium]|nr:DUF4602 domain-containing protein [Caldilineaceae bacterium]
MVTYYSTCTWKKKTHVVVRICIRVAMAKTNTSQAGIGSKSKSKRPREVQVVSCPSAFPISDKPKKEQRAVKVDNDGTRKRDRDNDRGPSSSYNSNNKNGIKNRDANKHLLDWHDTAKEIRAYGATAFERQQKRDFQDEQYLQLTGRHKKKHQVPLPIVRGIRKAAEKREAKRRLEAQQAGIVLPKKAATASAAKKAGKSFQKYQQDGPAPNIGFTKNGVYRVAKDKLPQQEATAVKEG